MALADRIVHVLSQSGELDDDELAARLGVGRQHVNQVCRVLATKGVLARRTGRTGKIVNVLVAGGTQPPPPSVPSSDVRGGFVTEDEVKAAVKRYFEDRGYEVRVAWGREPGVDIEAEGPAGRVLIEAKGEVASQPQKTNYFLGALGELVQRMSDDQASYGLALPDNRTYGGLVQRLPDVAKQRLRLRILFVRRSGKGLSVEEVA